MVNPGTWNPVKPESANSFCMLKQFGGVDSVSGASLYKPVRWHNIYNNRYVEYPTAGEGNVVSFDTANLEGITRVSFYASETGPDTGVFVLDLPSIQAELGFNSFEPIATLAAYYLDPNDFDERINCIEYEKLADLLVSTPRIASWM